MIAQLQTLRYHRLFWVFGVVNDKDINKILKLLPQDCYYFFCQARIPRALDVNILYEKALQNQLNGEMVKDVKEALQKAIAQSKAEDLIMVGGSTFVVAEVME